MSDRVDGLFGGQRPEGEARRRRIHRLNIAGIVLAAGGLMCTTAPGAILLLVSWQMAEVETRRVALIGTTSQASDELDSLRRTASRGAVAALALGAVQLVLYRSAFYNELWDRILAF